MDNILGGKRRAVVEANAFSEAKCPSVALKFPRFGEHTIIVFARVIDFYQRLEHVLPDAVLRTRAVGVEMQGVQTDAAQDHQPFFGRRPPDLREACDRERAQSCKDTLFEKSSPFDSSLVQTHLASRFRVCKSRNNEIFSGAAAMAVLLDFHIPA